MEELNKTQLILLALLVSFVTSIATGIVTVALLDQAPQGVTQTINRVVERTIEIAQPEKEIEIVTKETIVKEQDLIVAAVKRGSEGLFALYINDEDGNARDIGSGFIVSADGMAITDKQIMLSASSSETLYAKYKNTVLEMRTVANALDNEFAIVQLCASRDDSDGGNGESKLIEESFFEPLAFAPSDSLELGQTILGLSITNDLFVATGIITRFETGVETTEDDMSEIEYIRYVHTDIITKSPTSGGPLLTTSGLVAGVMLSGQEGTKAVPARNLEEAIDIAVQKAVETDFQTEKAE